MLSWLLLLLLDPDLVVHQSKDCMDPMGEWCQSHHGASGLTKKVLLSKISEKQAEQEVFRFVKCGDAIIFWNLLQIIEFVKKHIGS